MNPFAPDDKLPYFKKQPIGFVKFKKVKHEPDPFKMPVVHTYSAKYGTRDVNQAHNLLLDDGDDELRIDDSDESEENEPK